MSGTALDNKVTMTNEILRLSQGACSLTVDGTCGER